MLVDFWDSFGNCIVTELGQKGIANYYINIPETKTTSFLILGADDAVLELFTARQISDRDAGFGGERGAHQKWPTKVNREEIA